MICITKCINCKHERPLKNGWIDCCDAFPEGKPPEFDYSKIQEGEICNNGIGYKPSEKGLIKENKLCPECSRKYTELDDSCIYCKIKLIQKKD